MNANIETKIAELDAKLPAQFAIKCSKTGVVTKTSKKTFLNRVRQVDGDIDFLFANFVCKKARKDLNVDFVGRARVKSSTVKVIGIDDLV